jgi:predicted alpha/beta superfamily hydrolase
MTPLLLALVLAATGSQHPAPADPVPAHDTLMLRSRAVGEVRRINIHVPAGYSASSGRRYPVLYMPDGGIEEDFPHVVNTLDSLLAAGLIRPLIVVGIENTQRRRDMTGPTAVASDSAIAPRVGGSAAFRAFIRGELMPAVRARYRCTGETAIVGESLAGLFVLETFLLEPGLFHTYIAISPSVWWNARELVWGAEGRLAGVARLHRTLFLTAANEDGIARDVAALNRTLHQHASPTLTLYYEPMPNEEHSTIYRAAGPEAFRRVFGAKGRQP